MVDCNGSALRVSENWLICAVMPCTLSSITGTSFCIMPESCTDERSRLAVMRSSRFTDETRAGSLTRVCNPDKMLSSLGNNTTTWGSSSLWRLCISPDFTSPCSKAPCS